MEILAEQGSKIRVDKYHQRTAGAKILIVAGVIKKA